MKGSARRDAITDVLTEIRTWRHTHITWKTTDDVLRQYPRLCRTLSLAKQEEILREDGHHVVTRWQRHVAPLLLEVERRGVTVGAFHTAAEIFEVSMTEVMALVQETVPPHCVRLTLERHTRLEEAENTLEQEIGCPSLQHSVRTAQAVRRYSAMVQSLIDRLALQQQTARTAGNPALEQGYAREIGKLRRRLSHVRRALGLDPPAYFGV